MTTRFLPALWVLASCAVVACASDDPYVERRGDPIPDPTADGGNGGGTNADGGVGSADLVPFCDALQVIRAKCQRCHQDPPQHGAPAPFLTYEDTQAKYPNTEMTYADFMLHDVESGLMPFVALNNPPTSLMPPVEPLTDEEKNTLVTWLKQGAKPVGGTDCP